MVKKDYSRLILNKSESLSFEIINELRWTKVYYNSNESKLYLGSHNYDEIIDKLGKGIIENIQPEIVKFVKRKLVTIPQQIVDYKGFKIYCILVLMDPYFCIYRNAEEKVNKLLLQNSDVQFIKDIYIDLEYLHFE